MLEVDNVIDGERGAIVKVTVIVLGLLPATDDATEIVAVYVAAANDPVVDCSVIVAGAVVVFNVAVNHPVPEL
jgi:hypothetical protein